MKTTRYFDEQVRPRRPYISIEWCEATIANPVRREIQPDGRIRHRASFTCRARPLRAIFVW